MLCCLVLCYGLCCVVLCRFCPHLAGVTHTSIVRSLNHDRYVAQKLWRLDTRRALRIPISYHTRLFIDYSYICLRGSARHIRRCCTHCLHTSFRGCIYFIHTHASRLCAGSVRLTDLVHTDRKPPMNIARAARISTVLSALAPPLARPAKADL